jgi:hypothetical protein
MEAEQIRHQSEAEIADSNLDFWVTRLTNQGIQVVLNPV